MTRFINLFFITVCILCARSTLPIPLPHSLNGDPNSESSTSSLLSFVADVLEVAVTAAAVQEGILVVAWGGTYFLIDPQLKLQDSVDSEHHLIAVATNNLWTKLPLIEDIEGIVSNASSLVVEKELKLNNSTKKQSIANLVTKTLDDVEKTILANDTLASLYKEEKFKLQNSSLPLKVNDSGSFVSCKITPRYCECLTRQHFSLGLSKKSSPYHTFYRALVTLARNSSKSSQLQQIFDEAINLTVEKGDFSFNETGPSHGPSVGSLDPEKFLYSMLREKLKNIPDLGLDATLDIHSNNDDEKI